MESYLLMRRLLSSLASVRPPTAAPAGFTYFPRVFSDHEQRTLLNAALQHLDAAASTAASRRKRRKLLQTGSVTADGQGFLPEQLYDFEPGHFDGVIRKYREARITDAHWHSLVATDASLDPVLAKLRAQLPPELAVHHQCHVLHLASDGEILPHIDNVKASGSCILGISLGSARVLRLENCDGHRYEVVLEPGSYYIQRDLVRYKYKHSILKPEPPLNPAQRLSIMMRDLATAA